MTSTHIHSQAGRLSAGAVSVLILSLVATSALAQSPQALPFGGAISETYAAGDRGLSQFVPDFEGDMTYADEYVYQASAGQRLTVSVEATVPTFLVIVAPDGSVATTAGNDGSLNNPTTTFSSTTAGEYRIVVNSFHGTAGSYTVSLTAAAPVDTTAQLQAQALTVGVPVSGTFAVGDAGLQDLAAGNDGDSTYADAFTFQATRDQRITASVNADVMVFLVVLGPGGDVVVTGGSEGDESAPTATFSASPGTYRIVVNSFSGNPGSYTLSLFETARPQAPPPTPIAFDEIISGTYAAGDVGLEVLVPGNDGDTTYADAFIFDGFENQAFTIEVISDVVTYFALLDPTGEFVAGAGAGGDQTHTLTTWLPFSGGPYTAVTNSFNGDPGNYTINLREATREDLQVVSDGMSVDAVLESGVAHSDSIIPSDRVYRTYTVNTTAQTSSVAILLASDADVDLFVRYGLQIIQSWNEESDYNSVNEGGNETILINPVSDPAVQAGTYYIDVAAVVPRELRETAPPIPFTITATLTNPVIPNEVIVDVAPPGTGDLVTGMFASQLVDARRVPARINPVISPVQVWSVEVPAGAQRLEVRTFNASGRLDMVMTPPGMNLPGVISAFVSLPYRAITARDNERLVVDGTSNPPLQPGTYTVAVLDLNSGVASDYEIEAAIDREFPALEAWVPPTADELGGLSPLQRAIRATVQISVAYEEGSLATGSGSILTPNGLILTNHHVVGQCDEEGNHLFGCAGDIYQDTLGEPVDVLIGISHESSAIAEQAFIAHVIRTLPVFDLALLQIVSDLDGRPLEGDLPVMPIVPGLEGVMLGDTVSVIGYPSIVGWGSRTSLSVTRGAVTGFTEDRGQRVLVNVDANIAGGNSGGALVNEQGQLVGVPSNTAHDRDRGDRADFARALNLLPQEWVELLTANGADLR